MYLMDIKLATNIKAEKLSGGTSTTPSLTTYLCSMKGWPVEKGDYDIAMTLSTHREPGRPEPIRRNHRPLELWHHRTSSPEPRDPTARLPTAGDRAGQ